MWRNSSLSRGRSFRAKWAEAVNGSLFKHCSAALKNHDGKKTPSASFKRSRITFRKDATPEKTTKKKKKNSSSTCWSFCIFLLAKVELSLVIYTATAPRLFIARIVDCAEASWNGGRNRCPRRNLETDSEVQRTTVLNPQRLTEKRGFRSRLPSTIMSRATKTNELQGATVYFSSGQSLAWVGSNVWYHVQSMTCATILQDCSTDTYTSWSAQHWRFYGFGNLGPKSPFKGELVKTN